jgi:hypothetical protein
VSGSGNSNPAPTPSIPSGSNVIQRVGNNLGIKLGLCQGDVRGSPVYFDSFVPFVMSHSLLTFGAAVRLGQRLRG